MHTYCTRAGRTARYNTKGESLLILSPPEEEGMLKQLHAHKIPINKIEVRRFRKEQKYRERKEKREINKEKE